MLHKVRQNGKEVFKKTESEKNRRKERGEGWRCSNSRGGGTKGKSRTIEKAVTQPGVTDGVERGGQPEREE